MNRAGPGVRLSALLAGLLVAQWGCGGGKAAVKPDTKSAPPPPPVVATSAPPATEREGLPPPPGIDAVIANAREHLGKDRVRVGGKAFRYDCSGFVRGMFSTLGVDVMSGPGESDDNGVRLIHRYVMRHGEVHTRQVPNRGDLVFFDNTWDKNGNGKLDDPFTHIGLVEDVRADGTALVIHRVNRGIVRDAMNLRRPHDLKDEQLNELNGYLRPKGRKEPPGVPHTLAELWAAFGTLEVPQAVSQKTEPSWLSLSLAAADCGCEE